MGQERSDDPNNSHFYRSKNTTLGPPRHRVWASDERTLSTAASFRDNREQDQLLMWIQRGSTGDWGLLVL